jgi:hypothetical protein
MRRVVFLTVAAVIGTALSADGQSSDVERKVREQFSLTKVTADRSDITAQGTVVTLRKDGLWAYSTASPVPYLNTYNEKGKISQPFMANLGAGVAGGLSSNNTNYPYLRFTAGEKFSIIALFFKNGITFLLYSDPHDGVRYYSQLTFFKKGADPTPDQALAKIAEVLALPEAPTQVTDRSGTPPPTVSSQPARLRLPATYVNAQAPADQLQLNTDNTFSLQEGGQAYRGNFVVNGNNLEIAIDGTKTPMTVQANNLTDPSGQTWVLREQSSPTASSGGALRNEDVIKMAKAGLDDAIIIAKIKASACQFDTTPDTLIQLKQSGVTTAVLKAMTDASVQPQTEPRNRPAASDSGLPASYGGFLFDGTQYRPLAPTKISVVVGLRLRAGGNGFAVDGFSGDPPQAVPAPSEILVYQQNVDIASVHLARLEFVRSLQAYQFYIATAVNPHPDLYPSLFGVDYNQVIPVNLWRPRGQGIPVRTEPVVERNGMFRLVPETTLPPGRYALFFGDSVHASDIIFTTSGGEAGTAYYFEIQQPANSRTPMTAPSATDLNPAESSTGGLAAPTGSLPMPALVSPADGAVFDVYPRKTRLEWQPSANAVTYVVQLGIADVSKPGQWFDFPLPRRGSSSGKTTLTINFPGMQSGRWRVCPADALGRLGVCSEWRTFRYTR